ncbi:MAG: hypothetical protein DMG06_28430 [Acidobacteria bacterium]|nr:MAG: hypothetical protein DMG06_28430 [Acidobacteriota bacterium]
MDRLEALKNLLRQNPADSFARYGLAMEYSRAGNLEEALAEFQHLLSLDPDYAAAYFHAGQTLEKLGRKDEARKMYRRGIEITTRLGNSHARDELQAALDFLE